MVFRTPALLLLLSSSSSGALGEVLLHEGVVIV